MQLFMQMTKKGTHYCARTLSIVYVKHEYTLLVLIKACTKKNKMTCVNKKKASFSDTAFRFIQKN